MQKQWKDNLISKSNIVVLYTIIVFAFGIVLITGMIYLFFIRRQISFELQIAMIFAIIIEIIALSLCFGLIRIRTVLTSLQEKNKLLIELNKKTDELNNKLRSQRHNFLNHLQVIHGLLEIKQYTEANEYMEKTYEDIHKVSKVLKTSLPALNAILQTKQNKCDENNIQFNILATSNLENLSIDIWDLCAIIGNLIDNAINAVEHRQVKKITVLIKETLYTYVIKVKDNGYGIKKEYQEKIFNMGFTTKNKKGHGIGLAISKQTIEAVGGNMTFETTEKGTVFTIEILKKTV